MNKNFLISFLLYSLCNITLLQAETPLQQINLELEKCKNLQAQLSGKNLDPQRVAAFISTFCLDIVVNKKLSNYTKSFFYTEQELLNYNEQNKVHFNNLITAVTNGWNEPSKSAHKLVEITPGIIQNNSYEILNFLGLKASVAFLMHKKLLKRYKVHPFTSFVMSTNPLGLVLYILCNHYFLGKAFIALLQNYNPDQTPLCVKTELDLLVTEFKINPKKRNLHQYALLGLHTLDILRKELNSLQKNNP